MKGRIKFCTCHKSMLLCNMTIPLTLTPLCIEIIQSLPICICLIQQESKTDKLKICYVLSCDTSLQLETRNYRRHLRYLLRNLNCRADSSPHISKVYYNRHNSQKHPFYVHDNDICQHLLCDF